MSNNETSALRRGLSVFGKLLGGSRKGPSGERARHLGKLQKRIGIRFTDLSLLEQALTHRSYSHVTAQTRNDSNERMEFLGDSVLGLCVSQFLYLEYTDRSEGALSKMKSLLVSRKVLSLVARNIGLGEYVLLSGEESDMGGRDRTSILADSLEGLIGAIYLDQGYRAANRFLRRFLLADINSILKDEDHTNFKSLLQEYVQSKRLSHPVYRVRKEEGPEHEKEFAVDVVVRGDTWGSGRGKSKKDAEQNAARAALESRQGKLAGRTTATGPTRSEGRKTRRGDAPAAGVAAAGAVAAVDEKPARPKRARRARGEHGLEASKKRLEEERRAEEREAKEVQERPVRARRRPEPAADAGSGEMPGRANRPHPWSPGSADVPVGADAVAAGRRTVRKPRSASARLCRGRS
jgi:ribonuclease-3